MKKLLLASTVALFGLVHAQENEPKGFVKGDTFITGAVGYSNQTEGTAKNNTFAIAPSVGYFVSPNIAVGARVGYMNDKSTDVMYENKVDTFSVGAFGRYYWSPASKFSIFGELNADYATAKNTTTIANVSSDSKADGFSFGFAPGVNYFVSKNFALEAMVGVANYSTVKPDVAGAESTDGFNIGLDLNNISLGLVYKF